MAGSALLLVLMLMWFLPSYFVARYAENRGQSFGLFLLLGLFASWIIALIVTMVVPETQAARDGDLDRLAKLADLHDLGVLSDEEFAAQKADLLGR